jgi:hypothetical protein
LTEFRRWADEGSWEEFHVNHYDWWAFPIQKPSAHGFAYSLTDEALEELREDSDFLQNLAESAKLLLLSWGWDAERDALVSVAQPGALSS